jgi:hypothetical protein
MPVIADPQQLQINTAGGVYHVFIRLALSIRILRQSVRYVDVFNVYVDFRK